jgi:hypothetical protein
MPEPTDKSNRSDSATSASLYESEDHSDIDHAINQARDRERAVTRAHNSLASKRYAVSTAIVLIALGGLLVLAGIGWRIASPANPLNSSWSVSREDIDHGRSLMAHVKDALRSTNILIDGFVIFVRSPSGIPDSPFVATGIKYKDNVSLEPVQQWCYLEKSLPSGLKHTAYLISWDLDTGFETLPVSNELVQVFSTTAKTLRSLYRKCAFVSPAQMTEPQLAKLIKDSD